MGAKVLARISETLLRISAIEPKFMKIQKVKKPEYSFIIQVVLLFT